MRRFRLISAVLLVASSAIALRASEPRITASLIASAVSVQNGLADATFRIEVKNDEASAMSDVFVVFADNVELAVGSVPAEGSATSGEMTRTFDVSESPSKYMPIPVTLKYSVGGTAVETAVTITLTAEQ
jgi:hypothetical protein